MTEASDKAALAALAMLEAGGVDTLERHLNLEAVEAMEALVRDADEPMVCPGCGLWWDNAAARRLIEAGDGAGFEAWFRETLASPVNAEGNDWGERALADDAEG